MSKFAKRLSHVCLFALSTLALAWSLDVQTSTPSPILHAPEVVQGTGEEIGFHETNLKQLHILTESLRELLVKGAPYLMPSEIVLARLTLQKTLQIQLENQPLVIQMEISNLSRFVEDNQSWVNRRQYLEWRDRPVIFLGYLATLVSGIILLGLLILDGEKTKNLVCHFPDRLARRSNVKRHLLSLRRAVSYNDEVQLIASDAVSRVLEQDLSWFPAKVSTKDDAGIHHASIDYPGRGSGAGVTFTVDPTRPEASVQALVDKLRARHQQSQEQTPSSELSASTKH